ncbi:MSHA biogenesis protein MshJ [Shewanella sp. AS1]|uniref:MSHA biogenesis protein MshJ n=1 Tax=Shewanella sp. AS1 TaxID=2907626 RepID=UPI001F225C61|nr:MSHA biogenesis protein MshJ [Shewanella sp. AS1]MCE9679780.1 MSHA biogenesis protein MshJ [Shewanella sp. AS1]
MRSRLNKLAGHFDQLSLRERTMVSLAIILFVAVIMYLPLESQLVEYQSVRQQITGLSAENATSQQQIALYQERLKQDPDEGVRQRLTVLRQQMENVDQQLAFQMVDMVPAKQMPTMLRELLKRVKGVKLTGFDTLAPTPFLLGDNEEKLNIYSHGMKLTFEGDYFSTLALVSAIEAMPNKLYWKQLDYLVTGYPKANVTLALYTLSINKDFISVAN